MALPGDDVNQIQMVVKSVVDEAQYEIMVELAKKADTTDVDRMMSAGSNCHRASGTRPYTRIDGLEVRVERLE